MVSIISKDTGLGCIRKLMIKPEGEQMIFSANSAASLGYIVSSRVVWILAEIWSQIGR